MSKTNGLEKQPLVFAENAAASGLLPMLKPYAELMRLHKPAAILIIYWPYVFGALLTALAGPRGISGSELASACAVMFAAAFLLRSWGCAWNDIVDADIDRHVSRTARRPMARRAIPVLHALVFCAVQAALWIAIVYAVRPAAAIYALAVTALALLYPFAKRLSDFPQALLGLTFGAGSLVSAASLGADVHVLATSHWREAGSLILSVALYLVWMILADTIYAFQDVKDDTNVGVKSMAVRFASEPRTLFIVLAVLQIATLIALGVCAGAGVLYFASACGCNLVLLVSLIYSVDVEQPDACMWWFEKGSALFGAATAFGLLSEYCVRRASALASS